MHFLVRAVRLSKIVTPFHTATWLLYHIMGRQAFTTYRKGTMPKYLHSVQFSEWKRNKRTGGEGWKGKRHEKGTNAGKWAFLTRAHWFTWLDHVTASYRACADVWWSQKEDDINWDNLSQTPGLALGVDVIGKWFSDLRRTVALPYWTARVAIIGVKRRRPEVSILGPYLTSLTRWMKFRLADEYIISVTTRQCTGILASKVISIHLIRWMEMGWFLLNRHI